MADQPNPYESPRTESRMELPIAAPMLQERDGWKFVVLGIAILGGLVSFVPWLAVIFAVVSAPVFIRYALLRRQAASGKATDPGTIVAAMTGMVGLSFAIAAASAGAFLGVCTLTAYPTAFVFSNAFGREYQRGLYLALQVSAILGGAAFVLTVWWLPWRLWPQRSREQ